MNACKGFCEPKDALTWGCAFRDFEGRCFFPSAREGGYQGEDFSKRCGALTDGQMTLRLERETEKRR